MGEGGVGARAAAPPSLLGAYVAVVAVLGSAAFALAVAGSSWSLTGPLLAPIVFLAIAAVAGEARPLPISRGDVTEETLSTSAPFILALVAVGGVGITVVAQAVASLTDDLLNRRPAIKSVFNFAQYALSVVAARGVYAALSDVTFFGPPAPVDVGHLLPLLAAGVVMVAVNRLLVAGVVALALPRHLGQILREDLRFVVATHVVLLCIGAVAAVVAHQGVAVLALLVAPVLAVYSTAAASIHNAHQAAHDSLTGLINRNRLHDLLTAALRDSTAGPRRGPGLVLVDLDHFKDINDTLGHPVGDELLQRVAQRLVASLGEDARAARLGGDEFAVIVAGDLPRTQVVAQDLLTALDAPVAIGELELLVRASAGVAVAPAHGSDADELLKNADVALYRAKLDRDRIVTYSPEDDVNTVERLQLLADLSSALETGELGVAYQPQLDLTTRQVVGVEALIRWRHPARGNVPPDDFIPLAENSGLISELTAHVLDTSIGALAAWRAQGHRVRLAVNISARHLSDLALPRQVVDALDRHGVPTSAIVLEVTETGILADPVRVDVVIAALRRLGIAIAVDDYGTGHASLSYLKRLEIDELKVDRSFVSDMGSAPHDFILVRSTIALAKDLSLRVIAEGVETEEIAATLHELGCDIGQGYHLGRPMTAEAIAARLDQDGAAHPKPGDVVRQHDVLLAASPLVVEQPDAPAEC